MVKYGYNEENAKYLSQEDVENLGIISSDTDLGIEFSNYMKEIVSKMLLAKNVALLKDDTQILADKFRNEQNENIDALAENYLTNHIVEVDGKPIDNIDDMRAFVDKSFHFVLEDSDQENAFIMTKSLGDKEVIAVTKKMLDFAQNSSQFEGIVAHELGHYFVDKIYSNAGASNVNETLADKHAVDMLYYMGKNPDEYRIIMENVHGLVNMSEQERILAGIADEHGSPTSRLQAIANYEEAKYGDYIEDLEEDLEAVNRIKSDDKEYEAFVGNINASYEGGRYIGYLENKFLEDELFEEYKENGCINFSKVPYEKTLDKLLELVNAAGFEHFKYDSRLKEAGNLLAKSNTDGLEINEELERKASSLLLRASESVLFNKADRKGVRCQDKCLDRGFSNIKNANESYHRSYQNCLYSVLLDEAKGKGEELDALGLIKRMEEVLLENNIVIDGEDSIMMEYKGKQVIVNDFNTRVFFAVGLDNTTKVLGDNFKDFRTKYWNGFMSGNNLLGIENRGDYIDAVDELSFGLAYPEISLERYKKEGASLLSEADIANHEREFYRKVCEAQHLTLKTPYVFNEAIKDIEEFVKGEKDILYVKGNISKYSVLAYDLASFEMPKKEEAIGKKVPWSEFLSKNSDKKSVIAGLSCLGVCCEDGVILETCKNENLSVDLLNGKFGKIVSEIKFDGEKYDFVCNNDGEIIAIDEEARELRNQRILNNEIEKNEVLSLNFETQMTVLDALITLGEYRINEDKVPSVEAKKSLDYLMSIENIEQYLYCKGYDNDYLYNVHNKKLDLNYSKVNNEDTINKDFEKLKETKLYKRMGMDNDEELTTEDKKKIICDFMDMNLGDKTTETLALISPIMIRRLEERGKELNEKHEAKRYERDFLEALAQGVASIKIKDDEKKVDLQELALKIYDYAERKNGYNGYLYLGSLRPDEVYSDKPVDLLEGIRKNKLLDFKETKGNPEALYDNLMKESEEKDSKGAPLCIVPTSSDNYIAEYEVLRYINDNDNPKLDLLKLTQAFPVIENGFLSKGFREKVSSYIMENGFKELDFKSQKEIFDEMNHKGLFAKHGEFGKLGFLEELKKSYQNLSQDEKIDASRMMLEDTKIEYVAYTKSMISGNAYKPKECSKEMTAVDYPPIRNFFIDEYVGMFADVVGKEPIEGDKREDGSIVSREDVEKYHGKIVKFMNYVNENMAVGGVKEKMFEVLADKIEAQKELSEKFQVVVKHKDNDRDLGFKNEASARVVSSLNEVLDVCPDGNLDMVNFLTTPYSEDSVVKFREDFSNHLFEVFPKIMASQSGEKEKPMTQEEKEEVRKIFSGITDEDLMIFHMEFWDKGLDERSAVMQRFLENYAKNDINKTVEVVVDKYLNKDDGYYEDTKNVLSTLYKNGVGKGYYRKDKARFMLGAMLSAQEPKEGENSNIGVGHALALFCSSNGPAWVKFGQALSNVPDLPDDIRKPLSQLKDKAVSKTRWEIFEELRENVAEDKLKSIRRVGKLLGAGSFFSSLEVEFEGKDKNVLQMMRPGAKKDAEGEFKKIIRTVKDLAAVDTKYAVLETIVERANESAKAEVDIKKGYEQYVEADKNYKMIEGIDVGGIGFNLNLCPWTDWSFDEKTGNGFKAMEFGKGKSLSKVECSDDERKKLAMGYVATELSVLLGGRSWDIDRHGGQQNFDVKRDENGNITSVDINIFDTGALRVPPSDEEKVIAAKFLSNVVKAVYNGDSLNDVMFEEVQKLEEKGINADYVSDIQRGCIALNDIMEYQKEEKDENGNVVKEAKRLSGDEFVSIFKGIIKSGKADHLMVDNLMSDIMNDKKFIANVMLSQLKEKMLSPKRQKVQDAPEVRIEGRAILKQKENAVKSVLGDEDNPFAIKQELLSKEDRAAKVKSERKGNKISRNIQAWLIKRERRGK